MSNVGVGAVLIQVDPITKLEQPVSFCSRGLNAAERNYYTYERELL